MNHEPNLNEVLHSTVFWMSVFIVLMFVTLTFGGHILLVILGGFFKLLGGPGLDGMNVG